MTATGIPTKPPKKKRRRGDRPERPPVRLAVSICPAFADENDVDMLAVNIVVPGDGPVISVVPMSPVSETRSAVDLAFEMATTLLTGGALQDNDVFRVMIQSVEGPPTVEMMSMAEARDIQTADEARNLLDSIVKGSKS